MKISLFTKMFKTSSLEETVKTAKQIGYRGIEIMCQEPHLSVGTPISRVKEIKKLCSDVGLPIINLATYSGGYSTKTDAECQKELDDVKKFVEFAVEMSCPLVRVSPGGPSTTRSEATEDNLNRAVDWIRRTCEMAKPSEIKIVMEIHNNSLIETAKVAKKFVDAVKMDNLGVIHDAGNMYVTDTDYGKKSVELLKEYILHVHVKDVVRVSDTSDPSSFTDKTYHGEEMFCNKLLGEGAVSHYELFNLLNNQINYKGFLSAESQVKLDPIETAKHEYLAIQDLVSSVFQEE